MIDSAIQNELTVRDFSVLFGAAPGDFSIPCSRFIQKNDFNYKPLDKSERDKTILEIMKKIDAKQFSVAGRDGIDRWEKGWHENLNNYIKSNYDLSELTPKYVHPDQVCRLNNDYIKPNNPNFELNFFTVLRLWLFNKFLSEVNSIYEFGCGPGYNLPVLAKLFPNKTLYGLDWAKSAVETVNTIKSQLKANISGRLFDLFKPDYNFRLSANSAILTIGCLEQIGDESGLFLDYVLDNKPAMCLHVEPIIELYDENNLVDYLAVKFHKSKNYLNGFLPKLQRLSAEGTIELIFVKRMLFGSLFHDGWSIVAWKPIN